MFSREKYAFPSASLAREASIVVSNIKHEKSSNPLLPQPCMPSRHVHHLNLLITTSSRAGSISILQSLNLLAITLATLGMVTIFGLHKRTPAACASSGFGVHVVDQEFAVLAVAIGCVAGDADDVEDGGGVAEDFVHFFEGAEASFCMCCEHKV